MVHCRLFSQHRSHAAGLTTQTARPDRSSLPQRGRTGPEHRRRPRRGATAVRSSGATKHTGCAGGGGLGSTHWGARAVCVWGCTGAAGRGTGHGAGGEEGRLQEWGLERGPKPHRGRRSGPAQEPPQGLCWRCYLPVPPQANKLETEDVAMCVGGGGPLVYRQASGSRLQSFAPPSGRHSAPSPLLCLRSWLLASLAPPLAFALRRGGTWR
jgi:hypothetical protein